MPDVRRQAAPLDPPMVPITLAGTGVWAAVGLILLATGDPPVEWLRTCLAGVILGLLLIPPMAIHDRNRTRRRAGSAGATPPQDGQDPAGTTSTSASS